MRNRTPIDYDDAARVVSGSVRIDSKLRDALELLKATGSDLRGERYARKINDIISAVERSVSDISAVASAAQEFIEQRPKPRDPNADRSSKLVAWFQMTPTITERFAQAVTVLRTVEEGELMPLEELNRQLKWSNHEKLEGQCRETNMALRSIWKVGILASTTDADGSISYCLSPEGRLLVDGGVFAPLGVPGKASPSEGRD